MRGGEMHQCVHQSCGREDFIWYPMNSESRSEVKKHPFCVNCGELKNISDDRPKKLGYWLDKVLILGKQKGITQVQRRLMINELKNQSDFCDVYSVTGTAQKEFFTNVIMKYTGWSKREFDNWLE